MDASSGVRTKHIGKLTMMQKQPKVDDGTSGGVPVENVGRAVLQYGRCDVAVFALTSSTRRQSAERDQIEVPTVDTGRDMCLLCWKVRRACRWHLILDFSDSHCPHFFIATVVVRPRYDGLHLKPGEAFDATEPSPCGASSGLLFLFRSRSALLRRPSPLQSRHLPFCSSRSTWNLMRLS